MLVHCAALNVFCLFFLFVAAHAYYEVAKHSDNVDPRSPLHRVTFSKAPEKLRVSNRPMEEDQIHQTQSLHSVCIRDTRTALSPTTYGTATKFPENTTEDLQILPTQSDKIYSVSHQESSFLSDSRGPLFHTVNELLY